MKVTVGDICRNDWAGEGNPIKYFMVSGITPEYVKTVEVLRDGSLGTGSYRRKDVENDGHFHIVDHLKIRTIVRNAIRQAKKKDEAEE